MSLITIRVLEGLERGRVFSSLEPPVKIGREEDNDIQLNDDRVSRYHAKLQADGERIILTDLESTNGTRVNGHPVQMRVLQTGDLVSLGRCILLYGEIAAALPSSSAEVPDPTAMLHRKDRQTIEEEWDFLSPPPGIDPNEERLFPQGAPPAPEGLKPLHLAQLSDLLAYLHNELGTVLDRCLEEPAGLGVDRVMRCQWADWQRLVAVHASLACYLRRIAEPDE